jgi:lysophospholipase L1-like esterase
MDLNSGEYMESDVVVTGVRNVQLFQNQYAAGDNLWLYYRHGATENACTEADWILYTDKFESLGYVQLRVEAWDPGGQLVFEGDSLTEGAGATPWVNDYPTQTADLLGATYDFTTNDGAPGDDLADMEGDATTIDALISSSYTRNFLFFWGGSNNLITASTEAQIFSAWISYVEDRIAAGWTVVVLTITPRYELTANSAQEQKRQDFNTSIRNNAGKYGYLVADVAANTTIGDAGDEENGTYYDDRIHLTPTGYGIVAGIVADVVEGMF